MKVYTGTLLALCASNVWGFAPQASKLVAFKPLQATPDYLSGMGQGAPAGSPAAGSAPQGATGGAPLASKAKAGKSAWDSTSTVRVEGSSLRTWSFASAEVDAVQVQMKTQGRPLNANVDLWQGPDNTPQKMGVYIEDAALRPFNAVIATPWGQNTVAIRNTAQMEFPLDACVSANIKGGQAPAGALAGAIAELSESSKPVIVQGGAVKTYSFSPTVASVQILLATDGRPLNARIELLQGPNNNKQVMEVYTEDGLERPMFAVVESPGSGNVVRIQNTSPLEFPLNCRVEPFEVDTAPDSGVIIDGGSTRM